MSRLQTTGSTTAISPDSGCPNCGKFGLTPFYKAGRVPAHSCLLMSSRDQAIQYPHGDIELAFCAACGFVTNTRFDPSLNDYSPRYEETQHFSQRFNAFARELARRIVEDYDVRRKQIVEIGCGKGEFLALLCEQGDNRGVGIDPSAAPERLDEQTRSRLTFLRELYSEQHSDLQADLICCRHTLEHIPSTRRFVEMVRRSLDQRPETLVFFEVPDVKRVLQERAFWDIYYEHCSYFSIGSLARLFRECRFELLELACDFGEQYLWLMARPCETPTSPRWQAEDDLDELTQSVAEFEKTCGDVISGWKRTLRNAASEGRRPVVWGSGSKCVSFFCALEGADEVEYVVDINPYKHGKFIPGTGQPIVGPEFLREYRPQLVVAMNPIYQDEIAAQLRSLGVESEVTAV